MGAWGPLALDNDQALDWLWGLDNVDDLSLVGSAFSELEVVGTDYLDQDISCNALAACEVLARLRGMPGYANAYTEEIDTWVATHAVEPPAQLVKRGVAAIDRIRGEASELRELWDEADPEPWRSAVIDLRNRLTS